MPSEKRVWEPGGGARALDGKPYYCTCGIFTISRAMVGGVWRYALFERKKLIGAFDSQTDAAKAAVERGA